MKKFLLATVSMVALTSVARAADMPAKAPMYFPVPVADWTGLYMGAQGGVVRHRASFDDFDCVTVICPATLDRRKVGGTFGGLLGYNWQQGSFVYGVEGDMNWNGAKASLPDFRIGIETLSTSYDINWLATLRGRAGLALDATLLYITGGAAFGHVKNSVTVTTNVSQETDSFAQNQTKLGWTAGVGIEHILGRHWTARAEFRYVDLGQTDVTCAAVVGNRVCGGGTYRGEFSNTLMMGLVGLNYKF